MLTTENSYIKTISIMVKTIQTMEWSFLLVLQKTPLATLLTGGAAWARAPPIIEKRPCIYCFLPPSAPQYFGLPTQYFWQVYASLSFELSHSQI